MPFHPQPLFFLVLGLIAGTLVPSPGLEWPLLMALGLAALLGTAAIVFPSRVPLSALIVAAAAAGSALATAAQASYARDSLPLVIASVKGPVVLEGHLAADPRIIDDEMRLDVASDQMTVEGVEHVYRGRVRVFVRSQSVPPFERVKGLAKGDRIRAWVELRLSEPVRSPGGFDQAAWAMREGVHAFGTCKSDRLLQVTHAGADRGAIDRARDFLKRSWRHVSDPLNRAVTASMVLGDEGALDTATRDDFRSAGLLHLLVVSGSQVAALIIGLRRAMPLALRISWAGCALECLVLWAYCLLAGAEDSIVRATVMAMAFAVAVRVDLGRGGANFLAGAALVVLAVRPLDALDPGAQMSFGATLALITFAGPLARRLESFRVPGLLADVLAATLVASIAVIPLTLIHFHRFTVIAIPANMLAAPLAVALLYGSFATAALDVVFGPLASIGGFMCGMTAEALRSLARIAADSDPDWRGPAAPLALIVGFVVLAFGSGWRRIAVPAAGLIASLTMSGLPHGDGRLHLWLLDVGQGDALLIETPNGHVAAIDAGPAFEKFDAGERVVAEALWELGHSRLAFLALTHRHADHQGGALFLARHFDPERIYVNGPTDSLKEHDPTTVKRGSAWELDGVRFRVLAPDPDWSLPNRDENARSLVIDVRYGRSSLLLLGDAGIDTERLLNIDRGRYDVVKVGHHGAPNASSQSLVNETRPRVAMISAGYRNRFSHPAPAVVERWSKAGALVWRTDLQKTLHITSDGERVRW